MAHPQGPAADRPQEPGPRQASRTEPFDHQRYTLAALMRCATQIRELEHHISPVPVMERGRGLGDRGGDAGRDVTPVSSSRWN